MAVHPLVVHFPIALLLVGTIALIWSLAQPHKLSQQSSTGRAAFEGFVNGVLGLGYAGLVLSIVTGLFDMQASPKGLALEGWLARAIIHIIAGVSLLMIYGILLYRRFVILPPVGSQTLEEIPSLVTPTGAGVLQTEVKPLVASEEAVVTKVDWLSLALALLALTDLLLTGWLGGVLVYEFRVGIS